MSRSHGLGISFQSDTTISEYRELAAIVGRYRFETVSVYQDLFYQPPWPALLQLAERVDHGILGPAVVNPYLSHPALIAANLALLDEHSGGRAYLGVGRGAFFEAIQVPQPRPLRAIRECIELTQRLLRGDRTPYEGEIFHASEDAYLRCPIPRRELPVLVGGWGEKTLALGGELADLVKVGGTANPDAAPVFRERVAAGCARAGRPKDSVRLVYGAVTVVDEDGAAAEALARLRVAMYLGVAMRLDPVFAPEPEERRRIESALERDDLEAAAKAASEDTLRRFCVYGTPADVRRQLEGLFDAGVDVFELGTPHGANEAEAIRLLGERVLPHFATR